MRYAVKSDTGNVREMNEDCYNIIDGLSGIPVSFIIADGMGGHNSGEVASKTAVDFISECLLGFDDTISNVDDIKTEIITIMQKANKAVFELSNENEAHNGMGTTLTLAVVNGRTLCIGHVGDSRAYLIRSGTIERITEDHSYVEELVRLGTLTREEAEIHPRKNIITRALGCDKEIEIDTYSYDMNDNDIYILCTDGLTNMLSEEEINRIVLDHEDPETACNKLIDAANENGGDDNITAIIFKIEGKV